MFPPLFKIRIALGIQPVKSNPLSHSPKSIPCLPFKVWKLFLTLILYGGSVRIKSTDSSGINDIPLIQSSLNITFVRKEPLSSGSACPPQVLATVAILYPLNQMREQGAWEQYNKQGYRPKQQPSQQCLKVEFYVLFSASYMS